MAEFGQSYEAVIMYIKVIAHSSPRILTHTPLVPSSIVNKSRVEDVGLRDNNSNNG